MSENQKNPEDNAGALDEASENTEENVPIEDTTHSDAAETDISDKDENIHKKKKPVAGKVLVLFIILPVLFILLSGGVTLLLLTGGETAQASELAPKEDDVGKKEKKAAEDDKKSPKGKDESKGKKGDSKGKANDNSGGGGPADGVYILIGEGDDPSFYFLPDLIVNLNTGNGRTTFLKLKLTFEAQDPYVFDAVNPVLPRVLDQYQTFLREMRSDDINGTVGAYRLRRELLRRINLAIAPEKIDAVLIEEMLVQ